MDPLNLKKAKRSSSTMKVVSPMELFLTQATIKKHSKLLSVLDKSSKVGMSALCQ